MKHAVGTLLFCLVFFIFLALPVHAQLKVPEVLEYELSWDGIHAGTSELAIMPAGEGLLKITSSADSAKFISAFYKVRDKVENLCSKDTLYPVRYRIMIREGRNRRDKEVIFPKPGTGGKALYIDYGDRRKTEHSLPTGDIYDPLSAIYHVRCLPLMVGRSVFLRIFDSGKVWDTEVQVLRKEKIKTALGTFDTILIRPLLRSEGIFFRKGDVYIWLTDDDRRIPVMLQVGVVVGRVKALIKAIH